MKKSRWPARLFPYPKEICKSNVFARATSRDCMSFWLERLDHDKNDDRDQDHGRDFVDEAKEPRAVRHRARGKFAPPSCKQVMEDGKTSHQHQLCPDPTLTPIDEPGGRCEQHTEADGQP